MMEQHYTNLDDARQRLDNSNPDWTGPHPDFSAHVIGVILEAGMRDVVHALHRIELAIDAHAMELGRQRT